MKHSSLSRRSFLSNSAKFSAGIAASCSAPSVLADANPSIVSARLQTQDRSLSLYNIHTGERLTATFFAEGQYQSEELKRLDWLLRDHRSGDATAIHRDLYERLFQLTETLGGSQGIHIISGYRSPKTNAVLRQQSSGVAKRSLHMQGKAIDLAMPGVSHQHLHKAARAMKVGGVGYYPKSGFVHLDCGRTRHWLG